MPQSDFNEAATVPRPRYDDGCATVPRAAVGPDVTAQLPRFSTEEVRESELTRGIVGAPLFADETPARTIPSVTPAQNPRRFTLHAVFHQVTHSRFVRWLVAGNFLFACLWVSFAVATYFVADTAGVVPDAVKPWKQIETPSKNPDQLINQDSTSAPAPGWGPTVNKPTASGQPATSAAPSVSVSTSPSVSTPPSASTTPSSSPSASAPAQPGLTSPPAPPTQATPGPTPSASTPNAPTSAPTTGSSPDVEPTGSTSETGSSPTRDEPASASNSIVETLTDTVTP